MTTVVIQARMNSSRFPGKVLAPLCGKPVIQHVIDPVRDHGDYKIVVATTGHPTDDALADYLEKREVVSVFRYKGSASNVLARFYHAAKGGDGSIFRLTADCPLLDGRLLKQIMEKARGYGHDMGTRIYRDGKLSDTFPVYHGLTNSPDGTDVELFTLYALEQSFINAAPNQVEHVTTWMRANLNCESVESDPQYADVHYSVNTVDDLKKCEKLIEKCGEGARWQDYVAAHRELYAHA